MHRKWKWQLYFHNNCTCIATVFSKVIALALSAYSAMHLHYRDHKIYIRSKYSHIQLKINPSGWIKCSIRSWWRFPYKNSVGKIVVSSPIQHLLTGERTVDLSIRCVFPLVLPCLLHWLRRQTHAGGWWHCMKNTPTNVYNWDNIFKKINAQTFSNKKSTWSGKKLL